MKAAREHRVPLSGPALALVDATPADSRYLFPNSAGHPLSNMAMLQLLRTLSPVCLALLLHLGRCKKFVADEFVGRNRQAHWQAAPSVLNPGCRCQEGKENFTSLGVNTDFVRKSPL